MLGNLAAPAVGAKQRRLPAVARRAKAGRGLRPRKSLLAFDNSAMVPVSLGAMPPRSGRRAVSATSVLRNFKILVRYQAVGIALRNAFSHSRATATISGDLSSSVRVAKNNAHGTDT